jgi:hypothetical protein
MELKFRLFLQTIKQFRDHIQQENPHATILWQLIPHVGNFDEETWLFPNIDRTDWHVQGARWSHIECGAKWPILYNLGLKMTAKRYNDLLLDIYHVSILYINYFQSYFGEIEDFLIHVDSLHYCASSIFRGSLFLLQTAISIVRSHA